MADITAINHHIQGEMHRRQLATTTAVAAAEWLDWAKLLRDSADRPGRAIRFLLRDHLITGSRQDGRFWFIDRI